MVKDLVIVGSGIAGLAHAVAARERGWRVTVLERTGRPLGASVRNFGTIWPIGQPRGPLRELALRTRRRWEALASEAGFWFAPAGSLQLAYMEEGEAVLGEYAADAEPGEELELLSAAAVRERWPGVRADGLRGALFSGTEAAVEPAEAVGRLVDWLEDGGVTFRFGRTAVAIDGDAVRDGEGQRHAFDRLVVATGDEVRLLYPGALLAAGVYRCKLQMMRTVPQPLGFCLEPTVVADLTLRYYEAYAGCPSVEV